MGACNSQEEQSEAQRQNQNLENELRAERLRDLFNFKILLLGAGESGKSTIVKQLRLVHNKKMTKNEIIQIGDSLHQNVIDCMKALLYACKKFSQDEGDDLYTLDDKDKQTAQNIMDYDESTRIPFDFGDDIKRLFLSDAIKATYKRRDEFWLLDSCGYYMKHIDRFCEMGYTPNEVDQVYARIRTTGIVVSALEEKLSNPVEGEPDTLKLQVVDVGGQRNERKKWMHCFDDVKCILFIVNLAGYNQVLFEDTKQNRMTESLELLHQVSTRPIFLETPMYIFLNKKDLFEAMIEKYPLETRFPEYKGGSNVLEALEFIKGQFREQLPDSRKQDMKCFSVTGVVKKDVGNAFKEVKNDLLAKNRPIIEEEKKNIALEEKNSKKSSGCF